MEDGEPPQGPYRRLVVRTKTEPSGEPPLGVLFAVILAVVVIVRVLSPPLAEGSGFGRLGFADAQGHAAAHGRR
jgi:hypothetical protein